VAAADVRAVRSNLAKIEAVLKAVGCSGRRGARMQMRSKASLSKAFAYTEEHFALFQRFKQALSGRGAFGRARFDPSAAAGASTLGSEGNSAGLPNGGVRRYVGGRGASAYARQSHLAGEAIHDRKRHSDCSRRVEFSGRLLCRQRRDLHAAMYINAGTWIGDGTMIDSHALVGAARKVGKNCHISAAAQIGGVLEPVGALPVIIEDDVLVGGNGRLPWPRNFAANTIGRPGRRVRIRPATSTARRYTPRYASLPPTKTSSSMITGSAPTGPTTPRIAQPLLKCDNSCRPARSSPPARANRYGAIGRSRFPR